MTHKALPDIFKEHLDFNDMYALEIKLNDESKKYLPYNRPSRAFYSFFAVGEVGSFKKIFLLKLKPNYVLFLFKNIFILGFFYRSG